MHLPPVRLRADFGTLVQLHTTSGGGMLHSSLSEVHLAARKHLRELGAPEPQMPPFDESKYEPMPEVEINPHDEFYVEPTEDG